MAAGAELGKVAVSKAGDIAATSAIDASKTVFGGGLKAYRMIDVDITLMKTGDDAYKPMLSVEYKWAINADINMGFPGAFSIAAHVQMSQIYDLSLMISTIHHAIVGKKSATAFDACAACLDKPHHVFVFS